MGVGGGGLGMRPPGYESLVRALGGQPDPLTYPFGIAVRPDPSLPSAVSISMINVLPLLPSILGGKFYFFQDNYFSTKKKVFRFDLRPIFTYIVFLLKRVYCFFLLDDASPKSRFQISPFFFVFEAKW